MLEFKEMKWQRAAKVAKVVSINGKNVEWNALNWTEWRKILNKTSTFSRSSTTNNNIKMKCLAKIRKTAKLPRLWIDRPCTPNQKTYFLAGNNLVPLNVWVIVAIILAQRNMHTNILQLTLCHNPSRHIMPMHCVHLVFLNSLINRIKSYRSLRCCCGRLLLSFSDLILTALAALYILLCLHSLITLVLV